MEIRKIEVYDSADCDEPGILKHQAHLKYHPIYTYGYKCLDVIEMEKSDGRHEKSCSFVGYIPAKKCGCNGSSK